MDKNLAKKEEQKYVTFEEYENMRLQLEIEKTKLQSTLLEVEIKSLGLRHHLQNSIFTRKYHEEYVEDILTLVRKIK